MFLTEILGHSQTTWKGVYNSKEWAERKCPSTGEFKGVSYKAVLRNSEKEKKITPANITLVK